MTYVIDNKVGSPRIHLENLLVEKGIFSEYPKEGFTKVMEESGYYFSKELLENNFDFANSIYGKTSGAFMKETGYSRPRINAYMEKHGKIVFLPPGYYNLEAFKEFLPTHIKTHVEKRGRPSKQTEQKTDEQEPASDQVSE